RRPLTSWHRPVQTSARARPSLQFSSLPIAESYMPRCAWTFYYLASSGDLVDDQGMRAVANIVLAGDGYVFAGKRHQPGVLRRGRRLTIDGEEDGAIVAKDEERGAVSCALLGASRADGFVETLGVGACRINHPAGDGDVGSAVCRYCETGCSDEGRCQKFTEKTSHFFIVQSRRFP